MILHKLSWLALLLPLAMVGASWADDDKAPAAKDAQAATESSDKTASDPKPAADDKPVAKPADAPAVTPLLPRLRGQQRPAGQRPGAAAVRAGVGAALRAAGEVARELPNEAACCATRGQTAITSRQSGQIRATLRRAALARAMVRCRMIRRHPTVRRHRRVPGKRDLDGGHSRRYRRKMRSTTGRAPDRCHDVILRRHKVCEAVLLQHRAPEDCSHVSHRSRCIQIPRWTS